MFKVVSFLLLVGKYKTFSTFFPFLLSTCKELARDRLFVELARARAIVAHSSQDAQAKANSLSSAAVGASLGAGLGIVLAVVMGAASALRKP